MYTADRPKPAAARKKRTRFRSGTSENASSPKAILTAFADRNKLSGRCRYHDYNTIRPADLQPQDIGVSPIEEHKRAGQRAARAVPRKARRARSAPAVSRPLTGTPAPQREREKPAASTRRAAMKQNISFVQCFALNKRPILILCPQSTSGQGSAQRAPSPARRAGRAARPRSLRVRLSPAHTHQRTRAGTIDHRRAIESAHAAGPPSKECRSHCRAIESIVVVGIKESQAKRFDDTIPRHATSRGDLI